MFSKEVLRNRPFFGRLRTMKFLWLRLRTSAPIFSLIALKILIKVCSKSKLGKFGSGSSQKIKSLKPIPPAAPAPLQQKDRFVTPQLTVGGEDRDLLATSNGVHDVNGGDAGLDHLLRIDPGPGVDRLALHTCWRIR